MSSITNRLRTETLSLLLFVSLLLYAACMSGCASGDGSVSVSWKSNTVLADGQNTVKDVEGRVDAVADIDTSADLSSEPVSAPDVQ